MVEDYLALLSIKLEIKKEHQKKWKKHLNYMKMLTGSGELSSSFGDLVFWMMTTIMQKSTQKN